MQLKVSYEDQPGDITVVRVEGDALDVRSAPELRSLLVQLAEDGRLILVMDLSVVDHIDSTGLGVLVGGLKRVYFKGGAVSLVVTSEPIRALLAKTGLTKVFRLHPSVPSAVAKLGAEYAEESVEPRRAAIQGRARARRAAYEERLRVGRATEENIAARGAHTYEHISEDITVVRLVGEVDVYTAPFLRELLVDLVNHGRLFLVLDMTAVDYLDSTGFGVVIGCLKRMRAHDGGIALVVPDERIRKIFRITGMAKVLHDFGTVDRAIEHLGRRVPTAHV